MLQQCANPACGKPLHYLREGRVFVFNLPDTDEPAANGRPVRRLRHFWLCGPCSATMMMVERENNQIEVQLKLGRVGDVKAFAS